MLSNHNASLENRPAPKTNSVHIVGPGTSTLRSGMGPTKRRMLGISGLLVLPAVVAIVLFFNPGDGRQVKTALVDRGPLVATIAISGKVVVAREVVLSAKVPGTVVAVNVREGDTVKRGQMLASLDGREAHAAVGKADANVSQATEELAQAQRALDGARRVYAVGGESRQAVEEAESRWRKAVAKVEAANIERRIAAIGLENCRIRAPFSGTVVSVTAELGLLAMPGTALLAVADLAERQIEAKADAGDGALIRTDQQAVVTTDAYPDRQWRERVLRLAPATERKETSNALSVTVSLGGDAPALRLGQPVDLKIEVASRQETVRLPVAALINRDDGTAVMTIVDGRIRFVPVRTGIEDLHHVEVLEGLQPGDRIVIPEKALFAEGERVRVDGGPEA